MGRPGAAPRRYLPHYLHYGIIANPADESRPYCLICKKDFSNGFMHNGSLMRHFKGFHGAFTNSPLEYFAFLRNVFVSRASEEEGTMADVCNRVAYDIAYELVLNERPYSDAETLIKPIVTSFMHNTMQIDPTDLLPLLRINKHTVSRRVSAMAANVEDQLLKMLRSAKFSIQLEEAEIRGQDTLLMAFCRVIDPQSGEMVEDFMFAKKMTRYRKDDGILTTLLEYMAEHQIPMDNVISCSSDGTTDVVRWHVAFLRRLKMLFPQIHTAHSILYRENLFDRREHGDLYVALDVLIKAVNDTKGRGKTDPLYQKLCWRQDRRQARLICCKTRWLRTTPFLRNFAEAYDAIGRTLRLDPHFASLKSPVVKECTFYIADLFEKLDELNVPDEGNHLGLIEAKSRLTDFITQLGIWKAQVESGSCSSFPLLSVLTGQPKAETLGLIASHLAFLEKDLTRRYVFALL